MIVESMNWGLAWPYYLAALVGGYLLGSIPFGLLITKAAGLGDVRRIGSGNIGTTNVLRTGRKDLAAATLVLDALKGTAAVLIAWQWGPQTAVIAAFGAFLGHCYPAWLGFKGGKGVATYIGVLIGLDWRVALIFCAAWLLVAFTTRYSSLSALVGSLTAPLALWLLGEGQMAELAILLTILLWWKHRENLRRLLAGTESRIGGK
ncbi:glycerol-3-phosphate 1-O-acyltransferase PlsY [Salinarimonas sp.]|uniref:glycerol-3-phosphate 1-O-acyltransferase PlsY n=1 Tax=Salinarimonas sp. TaxID=2766526 RepID=UPI0032D93121